MAKKPKSPDERLKFLVHSTEVLQDAIGMLYRTTSEHTKQLKLWLDSQQERQERSGRVFQADLVEGSDSNKPKTKKTKKRKK